jgi:hypothetical protein
VGRLKHLPAHSALFLLRNCLAIPKLNYLLRCSPSWRIPDILNTFDETVRIGLENILNVSLDENAWTQATLPVSRGGIGIRSARSLSVPAFLASTSSTADLVMALLPDLERPDPVRCEALEIWSYLSSAAEEPSTNSQRSWEAPVLDVKSAELIDSANSSSHRARILAATKKESGAWLNAFPSPNLGTLLDDDSVRIGVGIHLGTPLCHPHTCRCGSPVDQFGTHGLSCQKNPGKYSRHAAVNLIIKEALASINVPTKLEPPGHYRQDGRAPDGLTLVPWSRGKCLLWDFTCRDTLAQTYLPATSQRAGAAAALAQKEKHRRYHQDVAALYIFCPVAVETLGTFGEEALQFIKELGRRIRNETGDQRQTAFLFQRISIAVQRGNAASILATIPPSQKSTEIFSL